MHSFKNKLSQTAFCLNKKVDTIHTNVFERDCGISVVCKLFSFYVKINGKSEYTSILFSFGPNTRSTLFSVSI